MRQTPRPDFAQLRRVLLRQGEPDYLRFIELFADREIMEAVLGEPIPTYEAFERDKQEIALSKQIRFFYEAGYDDVPTC